MAEAELAALGLLLVVILVGAAEFDTHVEGFRPLVHSQLFTMATPSLRLMDWRRALRTPIGESVLAVTR